MNMAQGTKKKKGRFVKGSKEAKEFMASLRRGKGSKKEGGNIFDDIGRKLKKKHLIPIWVEK